MGKGRDKRKKKQKQAEKHEQRRSHGWPSQRFHDALAAMPMTQSPVADAFDSGKLP